MWWLATLILGVLVLVGLLVTLLVRRGRRVRAALAAELAGQRVLLGPEQALYRGGSGSYPGLKGNGFIALTSDRLLFRMLVGHDVTIPVGDITGVREDRTFRGSRVGGRVHLIVQTPAGEAGFFVTDNAKWRAALPAGG